MKRIIYVMTSVLLTFSCGTQQNLSSTQQQLISANSPQRVKVEQEECEKLTYEESDFFRGYGVAKSADKMFARNQASMLARNEIVNAVKTTGSNTIKRMRENYAKINEKGITNDGLGKTVEMIGSIAEEELVGAKIIKSNVYKIGNEYEVHVCVELTKVDMSQKIFNSLPDEEKILIDYKYDKFNKEFKSDLEEYRKNRRK